MLKALVWFWLIDETLNANLVYQSDHKIGSIFQVMKQVVKIMMMVWPCDDQVLGLKKKKQENKKLKAKVKLDRSLFGLVIKTLSECDHIYDR